MKRIFKGISVVMAMVLALTTTGIVSMAREDFDRDPYEAGLTERVILDEVEYIYSYHLNALGDKTITIVNSDTGVVSILVYNEFDGVVELNGEEVAEISDNTGSISSTHIDEINAGNIVNSANSGWQEIDEYNKVVSWTAGTTVQIVAGILAVCIPYVTVAAILASVSATILQNLAFVYTGARIIGKAYIMYSGNYITYKNHWRAFLRDNSVRGPFDTMTAM